MLRLVLGQGLWLALVGIVLGLATAIGASRLLAGFLFGASPLDPLVLFGVPALLAGTALVASWLPGEVRVAGYFPRAKVIRLGDLEPAFGEESAGERAVELRDRLLGIHADRLRRDVPDLAKTRGAPPVQEDDRLPSTAST